MRCRRDREHVLEAYSFAAIDSTVGSRERRLEERARDTLRKSSEETVRQVGAQKKKAKRRRRWLTAVIVLLLLVALGLAAARWGVPYGACLLAQREETQGHSADAKEWYLFVERWWPGQFGAKEKAEQAECTIIEGLITAGSEETLTEAAQRAKELGTPQALELHERAVLDHAGLLMEKGEWSGAEALLLNLPGSEAAAALLQQAGYEIAMQAKETLDYPTAIERFAALGDYQDAPAQREECIYLYGRQLMREGRYGEACDQFMLVSGMPDAVALIRRCRYAQAQELQAAGDFAGAAVLYESLGVYEEAQTLGRMCRYTAGMSALSEGDLVTAAEHLAMAGDYEDAPQRFKDVVFTLGSAAYEEGRFAEAVGWFEKLERTEDVAPAYDAAVYAYACELEENGQREAAAQEFARVGDYKDAVPRRNALEYGLAADEMEISPEAALPRFEALGDYEDAEEMADECRYRMARGYYDEGRYEEALELFVLLGKYEDSPGQAQRSRYALAGQLAAGGSFEEAAVYYEACGAYLDAEERAMRARYDGAAKLEEQGLYAEAAKAFAALGSYEDAKQRTIACEDAWLGDVHAGAKMDMELGDYDSVITALEPYAGLKLPERYADIADMYETACLSRAKELIEQKRPLDALPLLERINGSKQADRLLDAYVYRIIGRWKDSKGVEYIFRRDGTCSIAGEELYFGGEDYTITIGKEPYPTEPGYSVISLKNRTLTIRREGEEGNIRLSYVGEAETNEQAKEP